MPDLNVNVFRINRTSNKDPLMQFLCFFLLQKISFKHHVPPPSPLVQTKIRNSFFWKPNSAPKRNNVNMNPISKSNALCVKLLGNLGLQGFARMNASAPIFPTQNYFRWKYLRTTFVSVSLSFKYLVRVEGTFQNTPWGPPPSKCDNFSRGYR